MSNYVIKLCLFLIVIVNKGNKTVFSSQAQSSWIYSFELKYAKLTLICVLGQTSFLQLLLSSRSSEFASQGVQSCSIEGQSSS